MGWECRLFHTISWVLSLQGYFLSLSSQNSPSLLGPDNSFIIRDAALPSSSQRHYAPFSLISPSVGSHCRILHWHRLSIHPPECYSPISPHLFRDPPFLPFISISARVLNCAVIVQHCHQHVFIHDIRSWAVISRKGTALNFVVVHVMVAAIVTHFFHRTKCCLLKNPSHSLLQL